MDDIFSLENPRNQGLSPELLSVQKIITYCFLGLLCVISLGGFIGIVLCFCDFNDVCFRFFTYSLFGVTSDVVFD